MEASTSLLPARTRHTGVGRRNAAGVVGEDGRQHVTGFAAAAGWVGENRGGMAGGVAAAAETGTGRRDSWDPGRGRAGSVPACSRPCSLRARRACGWFLLW